MQILTGKVRERQLTKNRDGSTDKILLQVELTSPDDIQTVEWINHDGEDSSPPDNSLVVVVAVSESYKIAIACDDGILSEASPGEKIIYSQLNGAKRTSVFLKTDGSLIIDTKDTSGVQKSVIELEPGGDISITSESNINLNGSSDFAVRFNALEIVLNQFLIALNLHKHGGVTIGSAETLIPAPITFDLSPAKVESVKLP